MFDFGTNLGQNFAQPELRIACARQESLVMRLCLMFVL
jgi:hypothetical protein